MAHRRRAPQDDSSSVNDYPASSAQPQDGSYGYFHVVQGQATDAQAGGERSDWRERACFKCGSLGG